MTNDLEIIYVDVMSTELMQIDRWHVAPGDRINDDEILYELKHYGRKAFYLSCWYGWIEQLFVEDGAIVEPNTPIARIRLDNDRHVIMYKPRNQEPVV